MSKFKSSIADEVRAVLLDDVIRANLHSTGEIFHVIEDSDTEYGKLVQRYGKKRVFPTLAAAYANMVTNRNDICFLSANTTHALTSMLTVSKSRCHFVGTGFGQRLYGQRTKVQMGVTVAATDVFAIKNTGVGNSFVNIKFLNGNTVTENVACFGEGGEYTSFTNCEFYDSTELDSDTHAEMVLNGDSTQFFNCTFGSLADAVSGDKVRPAILLTKETVASGKVCRDVYFDKCRFWKQAGGTATSMVRAANASDVERVMEFHDCIFMNNVTGGSTPAVAISLAATLTVGTIILTGDTVAVRCTKIGTAVGIFNCTPARVATATIGIQGT